IDVLEVIDVEHQAAKLAIVAPSAHHVAFESFLQVALVVDLRQTIDDGHAVDLFVILGFGIRAREELQDGGADLDAIAVLPRLLPDRKSTRLNSSHVKISYAVFCLKKKKNQ